MQIRPPRLAHWLMSASLRVEDRVAVLGDLSEEFAARVSLSGRRAARRWYRRQVRRSLASNMGNRSQQRDYDPLPIGQVVSGGLMQDIRYAIRSLRSTPGFTIAALLILTLGIGASTAIFSVVDAVVLRGLPFDEHDRLVALGQRNATPPVTVNPNRDPEQLSSTAAPNYLDWSARQQVFEGMAAIQTANLTLREPASEPEDLRVQRVTSQFFDILRERPRMGTVFTVDHETDGRHRVVILSDGFWRRRYGADPSIVGRTIPLEGEQFEVMGVMAPDFMYPVGGIRPTDVWIPYVVPANERVRQAGFRIQTLGVIARLKPGVSLDRAQAEMSQIASAIEAEHPAWNDDSSLIGVRPLRDHIVGSQTKSWMWMLLGAVGLVLLIACANVANLLLVRATSREREVGIRAALGAGRWRLVRQLLVESVTLSVVAMLLAIVLAFWAVDVLRASMPDGVPRVARIALDMRVLLAAGGLSLLTGMLFGIVPAFQASNPSLTTALKEGSRGNAGSGRQYARNALVVAEVALAVVLLVGAALFTGSFMTLMRVDPGLDPTNVLIAQVLPRAAPGQPTRDERVAYGQIMERLQAQPGVERAAFILGGMPFGGSMTVSTTRPANEPQHKGVNISRRAVSPGYYDVLRIPLKAGRHFTDGDEGGGQHVVIVNESAARALFPNGQAIGQSIMVSGTPREIVGVVGDVHQRSLEVTAMEEVYLPMAQAGPGGGELILRTTGDPESMIAAVRTAVQQALPDVPLRNVRSLETVLERQIAQRKFNMLLLSLFGTLGLVISAVGLYGVMAYVVAQRTREIGVRMALGATKGSVIGMVLKSAGLMVAVGLVIGAAGAWYLSAAARSFLFRIDATDPRAFGAAIGVLVLAAIIASALPARKAASVDPMVALRSE